MRRKLGERGFTFVEIIVFLVIFVMLIGMVTGVFTWMRHSDTSMKRLDLLHQLRNSSFHISEQLSYSTGIIFPPEQDPSSGQDAHQVVFKNAANEILVLYLNESGRLIMLNWTTKAVRVLTGDTIEFNARRPSRDYLEYSVKIKEKSQGSHQAKEFSLAGSVRIRNVIK